MVAKWITFLVWSRYLLAGYRPQIAWCLLHYMPLDTLVNELGKGGVMRLPILCRSTAHGPIPSDLPGDLPSDLLRVISWKSQFNLFPLFIPEPLLHHEEPCFYHDSRASTKSNPNSSDIPADHCNIIYPTTKHEQRHSNMLFSGRERG